MSELQKGFIKRIKQHERNFGLSSLSENSADSKLENTLEKSNQSNCNSKVLGKYEEVKNKSFPIIERYSDDTTGLDFQIYFKPPSELCKCIFVCHHGAGSSSMTFAKLASSLADVYTEEGEYPGLLAFDMRGHGLSSKSNVFDLDSLTNDFKFVLSKFHEIHSPSSSIYLVGHSLGGSVLTNYLKEYPGDGFNLKGLIMLDIVEETAVQSLKLMPNFIDKRPKSFCSYSESIEWHTTQANLLNNCDSAKVSVPDLMYEGEDGKIMWRTDLKATEPYWDSWFKDLSKNFIESGKAQKVGKLLILSGHETLDTALIIGQMQGKFQLIVFNNNREAGHFIHEDIPKLISLSLIDFFKRNDSPDEYMKKELGFVPKWGGKINQ